MLTTHLNKIILCVLLVLQSALPIEASVPGALLASILNPEPVGWIVGGAVTVGYHYVTSEKLNRRGLPPPIVMLGIWGVLEECRGGKFFNPWRYPVAIGKGAFTYISENPTTFAVAGTCIALGYLLYRYKTSEQTKQNVRYFNALNDFGIDASVAYGGSTEDIINALKSKNDLRVAEATNIVVARVNLYRNALYDFGIQTTMINTHNSHTITTALQAKQQLAVESALEAERDKIKQIEKDLKTAQGRLQTALAETATLRAKLGNKTGENDRALEDAQKIAKLIAHIKTLEQRLVEQAEPGSTGCKEGHPELITTQQIIDNYRRVRALKNKGDDL